MGVKNLWRLLLPISRRISIQSLSHQTLAIDASIWLVQISAACRDPETGRLLPNRPHVRIFLLRLMRLLFHEIRPVIVFDGEMPEVKRREIRRRRERREVLWRDDEDDGNGSSSGGALKRTAKKLLIQRLKELKKTDRKSKRNEVKVCGDMDFGADDDNEHSKQQHSSSAGDGSGAFASGFVPADTVGLQRHTSTMPLQPTIDETIEIDDDCKLKNDNDEVISIHSNQQEDDMQQPPINNDDDDSENDWELSQAVQASIRESIQQQPSTSPQYYDDIEPTASNAVIASLPTISRSQWIESQFRAQRIQSRQECIRVAGDMTEYSSIQIKNFLKGSKLNRRMNNIGALAGKSGAELENGQDAVVERDTNGAAGHNAISMEVLFGEPDDEENSTTLPKSEDIAGGGGFLLPSSDNRGSNKPNTVRQENESKEVHSFEGSVVDESKNDGLGNNSLDCSIRNNRDHEEENFNVTTTQGMKDSQPSQLIELASAGDQWADWGKDMDSDRETSEQQPPKDTGLSQLHDTTSQINDDSSSDDDGAITTFLTLATTSNHNFVQPVENELKPIASNEEEVELSDESKSVDWEDGDSDDEELQYDHGSINVPFNNVEEVNVSSGLKESSEVCSTIGISALTSSAETETTHCKVADAIDNGGPVQTEEDIEARLHDEVNREEGSTNVYNQGVDRQQVVQKITDIPLPLDQNDRSDDIITPDEEILINEFNIKQPQNPNIAALQHAQETASKLTDWAGRAVQRAIASHLEQHTNNGSPPQKDYTAQVDLAQAETEDKSSIESNTDSMPQASSESNNVQRRVQFLDTSLEGLSAAHNAILDEEKQMERDMSTITDEMKEEILKLLQLCGIPWIDSPAEAEAQCAALEELGLVDGVVTEDSDIFVFGGKKVYKNFFNEQQYVEAYYSRDAQKELGLGRNQLISLAMLLGGDYTDGVKGVGIVNGMEIMQAFPVEDIKEGLQEFRDWLDGFGDDPALLKNDNDEESTYLSRRKIFHKKHKSARSRWIAPSDFPSEAIITAYSKPVVDKSDGKFSWAKPDIKGLQQFCAESLGWDQEETDRVVLPVIKVLENKSKQRRLDSYFMKYEDGIKFAEVRSARLRTVIEGIQGGTKVESTSAKNSTESISEIPEREVPEGRAAKKKKLI